MQGDFTRFTFDPTKGYTRVLHQQGRVNLDADSNEQAFIDGYLDRITRMDLAGVECGAPSLNPGFEVSLSASGNDLDLSAGRFYAHGLICELFQPTTYLNQPFLPTPPPLAPVHDQTDLVYLDVWERHVTAIEDPSIREMALGGPDTTTRLQTIFQIRVAPNVGAATCANAALPASTLPSGALMRATIVPVPPENDLCAIDATGGYLGLEHRLYRVEIHDGGALGTATFKWSRDNGSVVFKVDEFVAGEPTKLKVSRLGRDQVLGLREGDYLEVLDDDLELAGAPGTVAKIVAIDRASRTLTLSAPVPVSVTGNANAHPKVRRWDQPRAPIPTAAGPIALEDGIQLEFAGANFKTGDYWTFAPRPGSPPELLSQRLPQGIGHFYCRLAMVKWTVAKGSAPTATIADCRTLFPRSNSECCCCTITVRPRDATMAGSLQAILDRFAIRKQVVKICLTAGTYYLSSPLLLQTQHRLITIEGCDGTVLKATPGSENQFLHGLIVLDRVEGVSLIGLSLELPVVRFGAAGGSLGTSVVDPMVMMRSELRVSIGLRPFGCASLTVRGCTFLYPESHGEDDRARSRFFVGVLGSGRSYDLRFEENQFRAVAETVQLTVAPFGIRFGIVWAPSNQIQLERGSVDNPRGYRLRGTIHRSSIREGVFRSNRFTALTAAVFLDGEMGRLNFEDNTVEQSYSGIGIWNRRTSPSLGDFDPGSDLYETLIDPVILIGATIARSYPRLPTVDETGLARIDRSIEASTIIPFPIESILGRFYLLGRMLFELERGMDDPTLGYTFSLLFAHNKIDAVAFDPALDSTGAGLIVWGDPEVASTGDVTLNANRIINGIEQWGKRESMTTVTVVEMAMTILTGNLILNRAFPSTAQCLLLSLPKWGALTVTGNILQGAHNIPNRWLNLNDYFR